MGRYCIIEKDKLPAKGTGVWPREYIIPDKEITGISAEPASREFVIGQTFTTVNDQIKVSYYNHEDELIPAESCSVTLWTKDGQQITDMVLAEGEYEVYVDYRHFRTIYTIKVGPCETMDHDFSDEYDGHNEDGTGISATVRDALQPIQQ